MDKGHIVLNKQTIAAAGEVVNGDFYEYAWSKEEVEAGIIYLKLVDKQYLVDAAVIFTDAEASGTNDDRTQWDVNSGIGMLDIRKHISQVHRAFESIKAFIPFGVRVVNRSDVQELLMNKIDAVKNNSESFVHYITPFEIERGTILFKPDTGFYGSDFDDIMAWNIAKVDAVTYESVMKGHKEYRVELNTDIVKIGTPICLPVSVEVIQSVGRTDHWGIDKPYSNGNISKHIFTQFGSIPCENGTMINRNNMRSIFAINNEIVNNSNGGCLFEKIEKDTAGPIPFVEAAKQVAKFGKAIRDAQLVDSIMRNGTSQDWIKYSGKPTNEAREDLRDIVNKMVRNGHDSGAIIASISLTAMMWMKDYKKKRKDVADKVKELTDDAWFIKYLSTQPKSRKDVITSIIDKVIIGHENLDNIIDEMKQIVHKKEIEFTLGGLMTHNVVREHINLGLNTYEHIANDFKKMISNDRNSKDLNEYIFNLEELNKEFLRELSNGYGMKTMEFPAEIRIQNLASMTGLSVIEVNHRIHSLMAHGYDFDKSIDRIKLTYMGRRSSLGSRSTIPTPSEIREAVGYDGFFRGGPLDIKKADFRLCTPEEHEEIHRGETAEFLSKRFNRPVGKQTEGSGSTSDKDNATTKTESRDKDEAIKENKGTAIRPPHYGKAGIQPLDFIRAHGLGFNVGNVIKYVTRAGKKYPEKHLEDLEKAQYYLGQEIDFIKYPEKYEKMFAEMARLDEELRKEEDER